AALARRDEGGCVESGRGRHGPEATSALRARRRARRDLRRLRRIRRLGLLGGGTEGGLPQVPRAARSPRPGTGRVMTAKRSKSVGRAHDWEFKSRFRRHAFGWKSRPAITRVRQAVAEIKKVAKKDPLLAAEGAVLFLERVSPALEQVDSSSGAIGTAVNKAIAELVPILAHAAADAASRDAWLERLFEAHAADRVP